MTLSAPNAEPRETCRPVPPTLMLGLSVGVLLGAFFLLITGALSVGATWDEYGLARFLESYFSTGWFTEPLAIRDGIPDLTQIWFLYSYGPVALLPGHFLAVIGGAEQFGAVSLAAQAFEFRHLGIVFWALVGVTAVAFAIRIVLASWRWALLSAAVLASVPLWIGHGMFNPKDIPVAAAYSLGSLAATALCVSSHQRGSWRRQMIVTVTLAMALFIGAGTRPFSGILIAFTVVGAIVFRIIWFRWAQIPMRGSWHPLINVFAASLAAYAALMAVYPRLFSDPISLGIGAYLEARQFAFGEQVITAGQWLSQPVPPWYLPAWFSAQLPLLVLIGLSVGALVWMVSALLARHSCNASGAREIPGIAPWFIQAFGAVGLAVATGAVIYNGSRQYLFAVPAFVVLTTYGIARAWRWLSQRSSAGLTTGAFWSVVAVGIAVPFAGQALLHPYGYTYFNAATIAASSVDGSWPTDYWRASARELWRMTPKNGQEVCAYEQGLWMRNASCANEQMFLPYKSERGAEARAQATISDGVWVVRENQGIVKPPPGCRVADQIDRWNLWQRVTIGQILECPKGVPFEAFAHPPRINQ